MDGTSAQTSRTAVAPTREDAEAAVARTRGMAADEPCDYAHIGTEDGEVFAVRHGELAMVAVSDRFALASLMLFDMRNALRELAIGAGA
jgi:hypothetical protein